MSTTNDNKSDETPAISVVTPAQDMSTLEYYKTLLERMLLDANLPEDRRAMVQQHLKFAEAAPADRREEAYAVSFVLCAADTPHLPIPEAAVSDVHGNTPLPENLPVPVHVTKWQPIFVQLNTNVQPQSEASATDH